MKKIPLYAQILIGMAIGLAYGLIASNAGWVDFTNDWVKPFGEVFIKLLKMIAVPLVLVSLIGGVSSLKDMSSLSKMGSRTIAVYLTTTILAVTIGLIVVNVIKPGESFSESTRTSLLEKYAAKASEIQANAEKAQESGPLKFLTDMIPENIFMASADNLNMLQVILFALLFGIGLVLIPEEKSKPVKAFFDGTNDVVLKMVDLIMYFAPIGVFALLGSIIVDITGSNPSAALEILLALGKYALTVIIGLLVIIFIVYGGIFKLFVRKISYGSFLKKVAPAQLLAFSTSSSAATLPLSMERAEEELGVSNDVVSFVLPLGATINMDGTSCYQAVAAVFIAQAFGMDLTLADQATIVLTATLASIGSAAVPGAGAIMLAIVLGSIGVPLEGISLIFAIDRPLDMCRTVVNVTGDLMVTTLIGSTTGKMNVPQTNS